MGIANCLHTRDAEVSCLPLVKPWSLVMKDLAVILISQPNCAALKMMLPDLVCLPASCLPGPCPLLYMYVPQNYMYGMRYGNYSWWNPNTYALLRQKSSSAKLTNKGGGIHGLVLLSGGSTYWRCAWMNSTVLGA